MNKKDGSNEEVKEIQSEVKEIKDGNKAEAKAEVKSGGMPWGLICVLSLMVIGILFLAERNPVGEILPADTVAKINSIGPAPEGEVTVGPVASVVVDKGETLTMVDTKTGKTSTLENASTKEVTVEFKDGYSVKPTYTVRPAPVTKEQAAKIAKAVEKTAKEIEAKPAPKEVVKTSTLVRKDPPPLKQ